LPATLTSKAMRTVLLALFQHEIPAWGWT